MAKINDLKKALLQIKELYAIPKGSHSSGDVLKSYHSNRTLFNEIEAKHKEYISSISSPDMAMSLELADFLFAYCLKTQPKTLLDLGSGFSSYVFRLYQLHAGYPVTVYSIDDNDEWLAKTKDYLLQQQVKTDHLYNLGHFEANAQPGYFDLVLLDLNFVEKRKDYIEFSGRLLSPGGAAIVDDVHKIEFLREVKDKAKKNNYKLYNIKNQTKDSFGRFSILLSR